MPETFNPLVPDVHTKYVRSFSGHQALKVKEIVPKRLEKVYFSSTGMPPTETKINFIISILVKFPQTLETVGS